MDNATRLARYTASAVLPGLGLAFASVALLVAILVAFNMMVGSTATGSSGTSLAVISAMALPVLAHGLFVVILIRYLLREPWTLGWRHWAAAVILAAIMGACIALESFANDVSCIGGKSYRDSAWPLLPWAWTAWGLLALTAIPSQLLGYRREQLVGWTDRVFLTAPFAAAVIITGTPFQQRAPLCTRIEGWGLSEGGMVLYPLLALFLFTMSFSLAVLSAAFVRPQSPETFR